MSKKRLIDATKLKTDMYLLATLGDNENIFIDVIIDEIDNADDVDAVEVSRLGELGRLMMPYSGCPRGRMGHRGCAGSGETTVTVMELDAIEDIDGNLWIPVLADDLKELEKITQDRDRWKGAALYYMEKCAALSKED